MYNNGHHVEQLYQRAMEQCQDYPMLIADNYLQYERANGTLDMLDVRLGQRKRWYAIGLQEIDWAEESLVPCSTRTCGSWEACS